MTDLSPLPGPASAAIAALEGRFFRPPLPDGYVLRPRLCERLQAGLGGRLLLVSAPAGFGKSSLAVEFCQSLPAHWHSLWLGLSARDSDPGRFLERLLEGLQDYYPALGAGALGLLKMRQRHQPFAFEEWLDGLLDELALHLDPAAPLLLVLDDYHLAQGPVLDRCLQFFLNHLPDGLLVMVTSRQRPDWHLARLRLSRQLLELHETDLRLTHDEALTLLDRHSSSLRGEALENLIQRSEGWVAGLRFWLLAVSEAGSDAALPQALNGGEGLIRDYLLEEVIDCLPAEVQAFCMTPRRRSVSAASCATRCAKPMTAPRFCVSCWLIRCFWCRSTSTGTGIAITICFPICCAAVPQHRRWCRLPRCTCVPAAGSTRRACSTKPWSRHCAPVTSMWRQIWCRTCPRNSFWPSRMSACCCAGRWTCPTAC
ncbi:hypothetical protein [Pseudomonas sp. S11A4]|uniref:hypothetical protein n=1 Tax=Pseudomonas sp. S11A4 TaxID=1476791 RepID=UPI00406CF09E